MSKVWRRAVPTLAWPFARIDVPQTEWFLIRVLSSAQGRKNVKLNQLITRFVESYSPMNLNQRVIVGDGNFLKRDYFGWCLPDASVECGCLFGKPEKFLCCWLWNRLDLWRWKPVKNSAVFRKSSFWKAFSHSANNFFMGSLVALRKCLLQAIKKSRDALGLGRNMHSKIRGSAHFEAAWAKSAVW